MITPDEDQDATASAYAAHLEELSEIHARLYNLAANLGGGDASEEAESIARSVARVAANLGGDIEGGSK